MHSIGLIGVGFIGSLLLEDLLDAGYEVTVYDVDEGQIERARERGANAAESPAAVADGADAVFLAVPGAPEVEETFVGSNGLLESLESGQLVIDTTTTGPETALRSERRCEDIDVGFLSSPLTRAAPREGLHLMVGGSEETVERASELLECVSTDYVRIGDPGDAQRFKLALQLRYACQQAVDAEIVEFCNDNDLEPELLVEFLGMDIPEKHFGSDFSQDIEGMGGLAIWHKDIGYAMEVARENETATPLASVVHEIYKATVRVVEPDEGSASTIVRYWRRLNGAEVVEGR